MKKLLLLLMLMIVAAGPPGWSKVEVLELNSGLVPEADFTQLGIMKFINLDGLDYNNPKTMLTLESTPANNVQMKQEWPAIINFFTGEYRPKFIWWKDWENFFTPSDPNIEGGKNTFRLQYSSADNGTMTITVVNPLRPQGVTKILKNFDAVPGLTGRDINLINITLKNKNYYNYFAIEFVKQPIKLTGLIINGVPVPGNIEIPASPVGSASWNITGINVLNGFTMEGEFVLDGWVYENDPDNLFAEFVFGNKEEAGTGDISSLSLPLVWFNPCFVDNDNSEWNGQYPVSGAVRYWNNSGSLNAPEQIPYAYAPTYCTRPINSDCFSIYCAPEEELPRTAGVWFRESPCYGMSSLLEFKTDPQLLSDQTSLLTPDATKPEQLTKNMYVLFEPTRPIGDDDIQTILEVGGTISGFNVYIESGLLCMGAWNREQRYVFVFGQSGNNPPGGADIGTPLTAGEIYLAHMEMRHEPAVYDPDTKLKIKDAEFKVRMILNGKSSPWYCFKGFQLDESPSAIGGEAKGTTYGRNSGIYNDYARWFDGCIGDVFIFAGSMTDADQQILYDSYSLRYMLPTTITYPVNAPQAKNSDWKLFDYSPADAAAGSAFEVCPNPFSGSATVDVRLAESQRIRVELFDMTGRKVLSVYDGSCAKGLNSYTINGGSLPAGVYAVKVSGNDFTNIVKVTLTR